MQLPYALFWHHLKIAKAPSSARPGPRGAQSGLRALTSDRRNQQPSRSAAPRAWRRPGAVTECHPVPIPTSRGSPIGTCQAG